MSDLIRTTSFRTGNAGLETSADPVSDTSISSATQGQSAAPQSARETRKADALTVTSMRDDKHVSERTVTQAGSAQQGLELTRRMSEVIALAESLETGQTTAPDAPARLRQAVIDFVDVGGRSLDDEQDRTAVFKTLLGEFGKLRRLSAVAADGQQQPLFELLVQTALQRLRPAEHPDRAAALLAQLTQAEAACTPAVGAELTRQVLRLLTLEVVRSSTTSPRWKCCCVMRSSAPRPSARPSGSPQSRGMSSRPWTSR